MESHQQSSPLVATPLLSVVIPVRNDAARLNLCLQSLRASQFRDFEVVVVDDGSTDDTAAVAAAAGVVLVRLPACEGPAAARNRGVELAKAPVIQFIDADVCVHPDTLGRVSDFFAKEPGYDAIFGSYDLEPGERNLISQYKNLFHRFVHQTSLSDASTFWTGCGAIRTARFRELRGFDTQIYARPSIEDIELGARLRQAGGRIRLDPSVEVKHLKAWSLWSLIRCDFADRGVPWTQLILRRRDLPRDLNLSLSQRVSAALACLLLATILIGGFRAPALLALATFAVVSTTLADWTTNRFSIGTRSGRVVLTLGAALLAGTSLAVVSRSSVWGGVVCLLVALIVALNLKFYRYFQKHRGVPFALLIVPLHLLYFIYSSAALATGIALHVCGSAFGSSGRPATAPSRPSSTTPATLQMGTQTSPLGTPAQ